MKENNQKKKNIIIISITIFIIVLLAGGLTFAYLNGNTSSSVSTNTTISFEKKWKFSTSGEVNSVVTLSAMDMYKKLSDFEAYNSTDTINIKLTNDEEYPLQCNYDYIWVWDSGDYTAPNIYNDFTVESDEFSERNVPSNTSGYNNYLGTGTIYAPSGQFYAKDVDVTIKYYNLKYLDQSYSAGKTYKGHVEISNVQCSEYTRCTVEKDYDMNGVLSFGDSVKCGNEDFLVTDNDENGNVYLLGADFLYFDDNTTYSTKDNPQKTKFGELDSYLNPSAQQYCDDNECETFRWFKPQYSTSPQDEPQIFYDENSSIYPYLQNYKDALESYGLSNINVSLLDLEVLDQIIEKVVKEYNDKYDESDDTNEFQNQGAIDYFMKYIYINNRIWVNAILSDFDGRDTGDPQNPFEITEIYMTSMLNTDYKDSLITDENYLKAYVVAPASQFVWPEKACTMASNNSTITCGTESFSLLKSDLGIVTAIANNGISATSKPRQTKSPNSVVFATSFDYYKISNFLNKSPYYESFKRILSPNYCIDSETIEFKILFLPFSYNDCTFLQVVMLLLYNTSFYIYDKNSNIYPYLSAYEDYLDEIGVLNSNPRLIDYLLDGLMFNANALADTSDFKVNYPYWSGSGMIDENSLDLTLAFADGSTLEDMERAYNESDVGIKPIIIDPYNDDSEISEASWSDTAAIVPIIEIDGRYIQKAA